MPRYDYRCARCGKTFELSRPFSQSGDDATCPACQGPASRIMATDFTVFSKGYTGWMTRIEGTDWPWRNVANETASQPEVAGQAESGGEKESSSPEGEAKDT